MQEADDIMTAVQAVVEHVTAEFSAAAGAAGAGAGAPGRWAGVDADARLRLAQRIRDEVNRLGDVFERVRATVQAVPGGDVTPDALDAALEAERAELARLQAARAALQAVLDRVAPGGR